MYYNMQSKLSVLVPCTLLLLAAGCTNNATPPESLTGSVDKPAWSAPAEYDMTSSMTAVVKVDLSSLYTAEQLSGANYHLSDEDIVAAFCGDECLGISTASEGLFFLYICAPTRGDNVTLRYYSSALKHIYIDAPFTFANDRHLGSVAEPYIPQFVAEK